MIWLDGLNTTLRRAERPDGPPDIRDSAEAATPVHGGAPSKVAIILDATRED